MLKAKDKEARRGNLITFAIVLALTLVTMVLENVMSPGSLLFTVIKKGAVYSLVAVSMNLLNGFTGLFSLGQAGFMLLGAYAYAIFMIPDAARDGVYYLFEGSSIHFSFQEMFQHLFVATGFGMAQREAGSWQGAQSAAVRLSGRAEPPPLTLVGNGPRLAGN